MPEWLDPRDPVVEEVQRMGPFAYGKRSQYETLSCICLYHGVHEVVVQFAVVMDYDGWHYGPATYLAAVGVPCDARCGYKVKWLA